jgi:hypothetical protein
MNHPTHLDNVAWRIGEGSLRGSWYYVTPKTPREMKQEPAAVYYHPSGNKYYQYRLSRRPPGSRVIDG